MNWNCNRILAVPRLIAGAQFRRHLLPIDVQLKLTRVAAVPVGQRRRRARRCGAAARRQQRETHPVPLRHRQFLDLTRVDVAPQIRRHRVDERRFSGDRHRFRDTRKRHLQVDGGRLSDQQLHTPPRDRREARELRRNHVAAHAHAHAVRPARIGHRLEAVAGRLVHGPDRHAGQHAARRIRHQAAHLRILRVRRAGQRQKRADQNHPSHQARCHKGLLARRASPAATDDSYRIGARSSAKDAAAA